MRKIKTKYKIRIGRKFLTDCEIGTYNDIKILIGDYVRFYSKSLGIKKDLLREFLNNLFNLVS